MNKIIETTNVFVTYLRRHMWTLQAELMHDPTRFNPIRSSVPIEHQSLSHPYDLSGCRVKYDPIFTRCFPIASFRRPIGPKACGILAITKTEEVPLCGVELSHLYKIIKIIISQEMSLI